MGGSSKKVTVGYKYYVGMHMVLHHGTADKLTRVRVDDRDVLSSEVISGSAYINKPTIFGGQSREGGVQGYFDFETGLPTQGVNSYLASKLGQYATAFRGVTAVVLRQMYVGLNPYLKPWSFRVKRIHKRFDNQEQWYDEKSEIVTGPQFSAGPYASYDFNLNAVTNATTNPATALAIGYTITVNSPSDILVITLPSGRLYSAYTYDGTPIKNEIYNSGSATELRAKRNDGAISDAWVGEGYWPYGNNSHMISGLEAARAAFGQQQMTGATKYTFYIYDTPVSTNTGGLSPHIDVYPGGNEDMNPAHIIRECLTDPDWGMGYQDADIDDASFIAAADVLYNEGMGISILWDTQTSIEEFVKEIIKHIDAALFVDRRTGKFTLKLVRFDYEESELVTLDESNVDKITDFKRPSFGELVNSVTVTFWDSYLGEESTLTVSDIALAQQQGNTNLTSLKYQGFSNSAVASRVAQRDLKQLSTPLVTCTIYTNRDADELNIGSVFKLNWPDYDVENLVMRVTGIAYGDGKSNRIRIQCAQDVFSLPDEAYIPESPPVWEDPSGLPVPIVNQLGFEVPYLELVQVQGQTQVDSLLLANPNAGYVAAAAVRPVASALYCRLFTDNGAGYEEAGQVDFSPSAVLLENISQVQETFDVENQEDFEEIVIGSWFQMGTEIMGYLGISGNTVTVQRGVLDTVPTIHNAGEALIFWDYYAEADPTEYVESDEISIKLATVSGSGQLALEDATAVEVTLASRAIRPYAPGNFKINGEYFPASLQTANTVITWAHRDRQQQTAQVLNDFFDGNIGPESGTTYNVYLYNENDELVRTENLITGTSYTWQMADEISDSLIATEGDGDALWNDVVLLINGNGADGSTSIVDEKSHTVSVFGNTKIDTDDADFPLGAVDFDGNGDYLRITPVSDEFTYTGDFSIEVDYKPRNDALVGVIPCIFNTFTSYGANGAIGLYDRHASAPNKFTVALNGNFPFLASTTVPVDGTKYVLQVSRVGSTVRLFVNGVLESSATYAGTVTVQGGYVWLGRSGDGTGTNINGHLARIRFTKGVARNSATYTPETSLWPTFGSYRLNGKVTVELESERDGFKSYQKQKHTFLRSGYGFNYGEFYGE